MLSVKPTTCGSGILVPLNIYLSHPGIVKISTETSVNNKPKATGFLIQLVLEPPIVEQRKQKKNEKGHFVFSIIFPRRFLKNKHLFVQRSTQKKCLLLLLPAIHQISRAPQGKATKPTPPVDPSLKVSRKKTPAMFHRGKTLGCSLFAVR